MSYDQFVKKISDLAAELDATCMEAATKKGYKFSEVFSAILLLVHNFNMEFQKTIPGQYHGGATFTYLVNFDQHCMQFMKLMDDYVQHELTKDTVKQ